MASAASFTIAPTQDASIFDFSQPGFPDYQLADGQGDLWLGVTAGALDRRLLIKFDLGSIPADQRVISARLRVYVTRSIRSGNDLTTLHRLTRSWQEGPSNGGGGGGTTAVAGDVTWLRAQYPAVSWTQAGGDYLATPSATQFVGAVTSPVLVEYSAAQMGIDVQQWLNDPGSNHGWILIAAPSATDAVTAKRFASREDGNASLRPSLIVETETIAATENGDVPLPLWALAMLAASLIGSLRIVGIAGKKSIQS